MSCPRCGHSNGMFWVMAIGGTLMLLLLTKSPPVRWLLSFSPEKTEIGQLLHLDPSIKIIYDGLSPEQEILLSTSPGNQRRYKLQPTPTTKLGEINLQPYYGITLTIRLVEVSTDAITYTVHLNPQ